MLVSFTLDDVYDYDDGLVLFSGQSISWAFLNPSVSPYKRSVQVGQESFSTNPAVRLYRYDVNTGEASRIFTETLFPLTVNIKLKMFFMFSKWHAVNRNDFTFSQGELSQLRAVCKSHFVGETATRLG